MKQLKFFLFLLKIMLKLPLA